jgi:TM2 domain-containing membrane protein YozV
MLMITSPENTKSPTTALLLAIFLGGLGIHRFYLGRIGSGLLRFAANALFFVPVVGPLFIIGWWLLDIILIANKSLRPADGFTYA